MKPADTLRMAEWCGFNPRFSLDGKFVTINPGLPSRKPFHPHKCLNQCALALEVIVERGLQGEYMTALNVVLSNLPQKNWYDAIDVWSIHAASAPQIAAAILAVVDEQLESQEGK